IANDEADSHRQPRLLGGPPANPGCGFAADFIGSRRHPACGALTILRRACRLVTRAAGLPLIVAAARRGMGGTSSLHLGQAGLHRIVRWAASVPGGIAEVA